MKNNRHYPARMGLFGAPIFDEFIHPRGCLNRDIECHALMYYYIKAIEVYENFYNSPTTLDEQDDPKVNFRQLFTSVAKLYGVDSEVMSRYWNNIDNQCYLLNQPLMPAGEMFRFNNSLIVR